MMNNSNTEVQIGTESSFDHNDSMSRPYTTHYGNQDNWCDDANVSKQVRCDCIEIENGSINKSKINTQTRSFIGICREKLMSSASNNANFVLTKESTRTTGSIYVKKEGAANVSNKGNHQVFKTTNLTVIVNGSVVGKPFPLSIYNMLSKGNSDLIEWTHKGAAFRIASNDKALVEDMLQYFSLPKKLNTFKKKLWSFGFRKYDDSFFHPMFHREAELADIVNNVRPDHAFDKTSQRIQREKSIHKAFVQSVTPSPHKRCHGNRTRTTNVLNVVSSPINVALAPSRRPLIPVSPIEKSIQPYEYLDDAEFDENVVFDSGYCFIEVKHDRDDMSMISVPMTPLSINLLGF